MFFPYYCFSISLVYGSKGANVPNTFQSLQLFHNCKVKTLAGQIINSLLTMYIFFHLN